MTDETRILLAEGAALKAQAQHTLADLDAAFEAWSRSGEQLEALAAEMLQLADTLDAGLADARAELMEWF